MKKHAATVCLAAGLALASLAFPCDARTPKSELWSEISRFAEPGSSTVPAVGQVEVAFSPNEGAEALVLKTIGSARSEIRMLTYSFTSAPVVRALLDARHRGVSIQIVVDHKNNVSEDRSGKASAAMGALVAAGVQVRSVSTYAIHHDKVVIADRAHVQTGSFNYSAAAAKSNSENVIVMWNNPQLANVYLAHWARNWNQGRDWQPAY